VRWLAILALLVACSRDERAPAPAARARLISLTPSATEIVAALGAADLLVGVDEYSKYPPSVDKLPKVGSFLSPNLEAIVKLAPTLVIVDDIHGSAAGALRDAGITAIECPVHALPDVERALRTIGGRIGRTAEAERAITEIDAAMQAARAHQPAKRPRVLAVIDREAGGLGNLVAVGPGSWIDELLATVGAENVLSSSGVRYPKVSLEEVIRGRPDVILDLSYPARTSVAEWRAVDVPATRGGRVVGLSEDYLVAPSPRVAAALATLAKAIAPR
jgi:iron complex transport system substrate-binding protein